MRDVDNKHHNTEYTQLTDSTTTLSPPDRGISSDDLVEAHRLQVGQSGFEAAFGADAFQCKGAEPAAKLSAIRERL
eukprot:COSAG03_NODE_7835_length_868_cov_0.607282_1_plen_75_part_10